MCPNIPLNLSLIADGPTDVVQVVKMLTQKDNLIPVNAENVAMGM